MFSIHSESNGRQERARNIGMDYATAPCIGFVDVDDWIELDMYQKLYTKLIENDCEIAMCHSWRDFAREGQVLALKKTGKQDRILHIDNMDGRKTFIICGSIEFGVWNKLYRRELLEDNQIYFPEKLAYEDHFVAIEIISSAR